MGIYVGFDGFLWDDVYYSVLFGHNFFSKLEHLSTIDKLNPSQLPNVQTEIIDYYRQRGLTVDQCYLQKNWNMGRGFYSKLSGGYFQEMYGGVACEFLYYPVNSNWAAGIEGAIVKRRTTSGLGFHNKIRKLEGFIPTHHKFLGTQVFFDLYYHWPEAKLGFIMQLGKFLANDTGVRWEVSRYFPSGLRVNLWYTVNLTDMIRSTDIGIMIKGSAFRCPWIFSTQRAAAISGIMECLPGCGMWVIQLIQARKAVLSHRRPERMRERDEG